MIEKYLAGYPQDRELYHSWCQALDMPIGTERPTRPRERERARQLEIHALNLLWWRRFADQLDDAAFCGHSLGFYAALVAAGVVDEATSFALIDTVLDTSWQRFADNDKTVFVVTTKRECAFEEIAARLEVEILSENNAQQRVMYGARAQYEQVLHALADNLLGAADLGTRIPFHSCQMLRVKDALDARLAHFASHFRPPAAPLWSHISGRRLFNAEQAFAVVCDQPHQRVRWLRMVDALIQAGRTEFVEVGPNRILSQIVRWVAPRLTVQFVDQLRR